MYIIHVHSCLLGYKTVLLVFIVHHQSDTDLPLVPPQTDYQQETTCTVYWCQYTGLGGTDEGPTQHLKLT